MFGFPAGTSEPDPDPGVPPRRARECVLCFRVIGLVDDIELRRGPDRAICVTCYHAETSTELRPAPELRQAVRAVLTDIAGRKLLDGTYSSYEAKEWFDKAA